MASGKTAIEKELDELRGKGLAKGHRIKYSVNNTGRLSTPEEAFAFLAAHRAAKKIKAKITPPSNLKSNDLDSWYMQQRAHNNEMKRKRMEAMNILRGYRSGHVANENANYTGAAGAGSGDWVSKNEESGPSTPSKAPVVADAKSPDYSSSGLMAPRRLVPEDKESEAVAVPEEEASLEDMEEEDLDEENVEELMKSFITAKEAEGETVVINEEGEIEVPENEIPANEDDDDVKEQNVDDAVAADGEENDNSDAEEGVVDKDSAENPDEVKEDSNDTPEEAKEDPNDAPVEVQEESNDTPVEAQEESNDTPVEAKEESYDAPDDVDTEKEVDNDDTAAAAVKEEIEEDKEETPSDAAPTEEEPEKEEISEKDSSESDVKDEVSTEEKSGVENDVSEPVAESDEADETPQLVDEAPEEEGNNDEAPEAETNNEEEVAPAVTAVDSVDKEEKKSDDSVVETESKKLEWRDVISSEEGAKFPPESGRYHLYVSYACPWAHQALIVLSLKGLEDAISVTVAHPIWRKTNLDNTDDKHVGWVFGNPEGEPFRNTADLGGPFPPAYPGNEADPVFNAYSVRELYERANDNIGKYTLPLLWDKQLNTIVNNESSDIIRMLNSAFNKFAKNPDLDLYPTDKQKDIDEVNKWVHPSLNNAVYRCGFATTQEAYDSAINELTEAFDKVDTVLKSQKYITGDEFTEADVRLFVTLLRFDEVSSLYMKTNTRSVASTPALLNYCREVYRIPGVADTCHMDQIKAHYYCSHIELNRFSIIPRGPDFMGLLNEDGYEC